MNQITKLVESIPAGQGAGKYLSRLTDESREGLEAFEKWLQEAENKAPSTAAQYKADVARAVCHIEDGGDVSELSTDIKSALNALKRYADAGFLPADDEPVAG